MDEKSMILEQERQEKEKKRKKRKKYKMAAGILVILLLAGGTWYAGWGRYLLAEKEADTVEIKVSAGQSVTYARITAINGNEITYAIAEKMDVELPENSEESAGEGGRPGGAGRGQRGEGTSQTTEGGFPLKENETTSDVISEVASTEGSQRPDTSAASAGGEIPSMSGMPGGGEMPDMSNMPQGGRGQMGGFGQMGSNRNNANAVSAVDTNIFTYEDTVYRVGEESVTTYIPVGTDVTTKLGTVTTFSRLSTGDCVAIVTEEDEDTQIIMAVYIIG